MVVCLRPGEASARSNCPFRTCHHSDASYDGGFVGVVDVERSIELLLAQEYLGDVGEDGGTFGVHE